MLKNWVFIQELVNFDISLIKTAEKHTLPWVPEPKNNKKKK